MLFFCSLFFCLSHCQVKSDTFCSCNKLIGIKKAAFIQFGSVDLLRCTRSKLTKNGVNCQLKSFIFLKLISGGMVFLNVEFRASKCFQLSFLSKWQSENSCFAWRKKQPNLKYSVIFSKCKQKYLIIMQTPF